MAVAPMTGKIPSACVTSVNNSFIDVVYIVAAQLCQAGIHLATDQFDHLLQAVITVGTHRVQQRSADKNKIGTDRERFNDRHATAHAAVEQ